MAAALDWDVIVVGAGPAGSALARQLASTRRVLVLERAPATGHVSPRIGESLPGSARVLLTRLGVFSRFMADAHAERGATISAWDSDEPTWFDSLRDPNGPGWHLDRARFDECLREAAREAGTHFVWGCGLLRIERGANAFVVADPRGETYRAPVLVDASGRSAMAARQLGVERHEGDSLVCLYAHLPVATLASGETTDEDDCTRICTDHNGWWYSVRVPSGARVLAFHLDADDSELKALRDTSKLLTKARRQPLLAAVLPSVATTTVSARVAGSSVVDLRALASMPNFYAIGDASVAFDPVASQGLFHALASAASAAGAIERRGGASHAAFVAELSAVHARYREELCAVYAGVARRRSGAFWERRGRTLERGDAPRVVGEN